jgi:glycosyltransferase involved in cell wall biosynthesis
MSAPIKILHVVYFLEPGGMENGIVNISKGLDPKQFDIHYCCLERAGAFVERLPNPQNVHVLNKRSGFSLGAVVSLTKLIRSLKPDLIHSHNLGPLIYSGLSSGFGFLCPIVQGEHSLLTPMECTARRLRQRRWLYRGCARVHTVSEQLRQQLLQLGFHREKVVTICNGVDTDRFSESDPLIARNAIGLGHLPANARILGIVGRFGAFKRHDVLVEAFNLLAEDDSTLHLLIVGDGGPNKDRVRAQVAASRFANRIHLVGYQKDVRPFYQSMNVLVVPSENEGMSNAVLEAMACGTPVLAHDVCGNSEVITPGSDGWVANLDTPDNLCIATKNILAKPSELAKMKQMARAKVLKQFSMAAMLNQYADLYSRNARKG